MMMTFLVFFIGTCQPVNCMLLVALRFLLNERKPFLFICLLVLLHDEILVLMCVLLNVCSLEMTLFLIMHYCLKMCRYLESLLEKSFSLIFPSFCLKVMCKLTSGLCMLSLPW